MTRKDKASTKLIRNRISFLFRNFLSFVSHNKWLILVFATGIAFRLVSLGFAPGMGAINQDEAFAGYEAYSLLKFGVDSHGFAFPVYFISWGSGMNVLETYLMIPFVAILGLTTTSIRLPIAILSIVSMFSFYGIAKRVFPKKFSVLAVLIYSFVPWNFIVSRWAVESNTAPFVLIIALYFLVKSTEKKQFIIPSLICYGLSFYTYSCFWPVLPLIILGSIIYLLAKKRLYFDKYLVIGAILFFIICVPAALFMGVNYGFIPEIKNSIFSVPKMSTLRSGEISPSIHNALHTAKIILLQKDVSVWNTPRKFGWYYHFMTPVWIFGVCIFIYSAIRERKKCEHNQIVFLLFIQLICAAILGVIVEDTNSTRIGIAHIPIIFFAIYGIYNLCLIISRLFSKSKNPIAFLRVQNIFAIFFVFCASLFLGFYFSAYNLDVSRKNDLDQKLALEYISTNNTEDQPVHLLTDVAVSKILFYDYTLPSVESESQKTVSFECGKRDLCYSRAGNYYYESLDSVDSIATSDYYLCNIIDQECLDLLNHEDVGHKFYGNYLIISTSITSNNK